MRERVASIQDSELHHDFGKTRVGNPVQEAKSRRVTGEVRRLTG